MNAAQPSTRRRFAAALTVFGRNFIVSLISALIALPILSYLGAPAQLAGAPIFGSSSISLSDETMLCLRIGSVVLTIAFFLFVGRFSIPLYVKAFGVNPGILRIAAAVVSPLMFIAATTFLFAVLLQVIQRDNFAQALLEYTTVTVWPFAILPMVMGLIDGLRRPLRGEAQLPADIKEGFEIVKNGVQKLPGMIDRAAGVLDPALKGNFATMILSALSVTSIATAGMSDNPITFVLLFALPATIAVGSCVAYLLVEELHSTILGQRSRKRWQKLRFGLFAVLLMPGLVLVLIGCIVSGAYFVNGVYTDVSIPMMQFLRGFNENPKQGIAYAIVLLIPMYWVVYFLYRSNQHALAVEQVVPADVQPAAR